MKNDVSVSAPGKLMLFGEHAVVYNRPCIVAAVNQRIKLKASKISEPFFELEAPDVEVSNYKKPLSEIGLGEIPKGAKFVEIALRNFLEKYPQKQGVRFETVAEFKSTFGFGSSSASAVCTVKALSELFDVPLTNKEIFDLAYKTVLDVSGVGSGFDLAAAIYGGTIYFLTGGKVIKPLQIKSLPLVVGYTGIKADTPTIVKEIASKMDKKPDYYNNIFNNIKKIVLQAKDTLVSEDFKKVGELMDLNQGQLKKLGVSSKNLDSMIKAARNAGAYGAKISGAGVGDCMIALVSSKKKEKIENAIEKTGGQILKVEVNAQGVSI